MLVVNWVVDVKIFLEKRHNKGIDTLVVLKKKPYIQTPNPLKGANPPPPKGGLESYNLNIPIKIKIKNPLPRSRGERGHGKQTTSQLFFLGLRVTVSITVVNLCLAAYFKDKNRPVIALLAIR
jgi:hypothetical protein